MSKRLKALLITTDMICQIAKGTKGGFQGHYRVVEGPLPEDAKALYAIKHNDGVIGIVLESESWEEIIPGSIPIVDGVVLESARDLYMCGQFIAKTKKGSVWDFRGIFTSKEEAVSACKDKNYFIAPVEVGKELPKETSECPGVEYPLLKGYGIRDIFRN